MTGMGEQVLRGTNPFATRHVRPGRLVPLDAEGRPLDIGRLVETLAGVGGSAALVGPHGSGKTTLLWRLADALEVAGIRVRRTRLGRPADVIVLVAAIAGCRGGGTVCIDSWERIGGLGTVMIRAAARVLGTRLLVTAHTPGALPTLVNCATSPRLLVALVERLLSRPHQPRMIDADDIDEAFRRSAGDVREALFLLYDRFEERARMNRSTSPAVA